MTRPLPNMESFNLNLAENCVLCTIFFPPLFKEKKEGWEMVKHPHFPKNRYKGYGGLSDGGDVPASLS